MRAAMTRRYVTVVVTATRIEGKYPRTSSQRIALVHCIVDLLLSIYN